MQFVIYRFRFSAGVHFGAGSLWDGMNTLLLVEEGKRSSGLPPPCVWMRSG